MDFEEQDSFLGGVVFDGFSLESDENKYLFDSDGYYEREMNEEEISSNSPKNDDYLYDPDGYYEDGKCEMNKEEVNRYYQALKESEGFDVPTFPNTYAFGIIVPIPKHIFSQDQDLRVCAEEAIKHYNKENGTNFEFVKIVKANERAACGILYFITFEVKQIGTAQEFPTTFFEARVLSGILDTIKVELCRPKSSS